MQATRRPVIIAATKKPIARPTIWVCQSCGKRNTQRKPPGIIDFGWDESCMLSSVECWADSVEFDDSGRVCYALSCEFSEDTVANEQPA